MGMRSYRVSPLIDEFEEIFSMSGVVVSPMDPLAGAGTPGTVIVSPMDPASTPVGASTTVSVIATRSFTTPTGSQLA